MDSIFINSENSKTSDLHGVFFNLSDKNDLKRSEKHVSLSNCSIWYAWKNIKRSY